jgi:hypothetical protein
VAKLRERISVGKRVRQEIDRERFDLRIEISNRYVALERA